MVTASVRGKRHRRDRQAARKLLLELTGQLLRVRILARPSLLLCSDVRALARVHAQLPMALVPEGTRVVLLLLLWAARKPAVAAALIQRIRKSPRAPWTSTEASSMLRRMLARRAFLGDRCFWRGLAARNLHVHPKWTVAGMERALAGMLPLSSSCDGPAVVANLATLPGMSHYLACHAMRSISAACGQSVRHASAPCRAMSQHVSLLESLISFQDFANASVQWLPKSDGRDPRNLANMYCAVSKVLTSEGLVRRLSLYKTDGNSFARDLVEGGLRHLTSTLQRLTPLTDERIKESSANSEKSAVNLRLPWDADTRDHHSAEALDCLALVRNDLRQLGWCKARK